MTPEQRIYTIIITLLGMPMTACNSDKSKSVTTSGDIETIAPTPQQPISETPKTLLPTGDPEKDWILAEQAVDAWLYFHLSDFQSYEPLIRSTDYDPDRNIYTHHLRFRMINDQGGPVTFDRDYEVDLNRVGENGNPFLVVEKSHTDF